MVRKPSRKGAVWSLGKWPLASRVQRASVSCEVAPTPKSRLTARESPLIITTREKKGCFSWFVDEWEKPPSAFPRDELIVLPSRSWSSTQLRRFETFNSQEVRSTLKIGLERFCGHFQGDSFTPPAEKAF